MRVQSKFHQIVCLRVREGVGENNQCCSIHTITVSIIKVFHRVLQNTILVLLFALIHGKIFPLTCLIIHCRWTDLYVQLLYLDFPFSVYKLAKIPAYFSYVPGTVKLMYTFIWVVKWGGGNTGVRERERNFWLKAK